MHPQDPHNIIRSGFEIPAIRMLPYWRIRFMAPADEIDTLFDEIIKVAPLVYGKTDRNAIRACLPAAETALISTLERHLRHCGHTCV